MARLRLNNVCGVLGAQQNPTDTTLVLTAPLTHDDGQAVATIASPDTLDITVDGDVQASGLPNPKFEVQRITAYTSGATTVSAVTRAIKGTATTHAIGAKVGHDPTTDDFGTLAGPFAESQVTGLATDLSTNASAITAETTRAQAAEALALQKASNLSDVASVSTARTNLGLGTAATHASTDFDAAGLSAAETTRAQAAEALLAPLASPHLTGTPLAPTATPGTNTTQLASTAYADAAVAVETTRATTAEAGKLGSTAAAGGDLTGNYPNPTLVAAGPGVTGPIGDASHTAAVTIDAKGRVTALTSTAIVIAESAVTSLTTDLAAKAPLASPALTGTPTVPTATPSTNTTQAASTAYADAAVAVETSRATTAEGTKVPTTRQVIAGSGLSGGGALSADRTLSLNVGSVGTVLTGLIANIPAAGTAGRFYFATDVGPAPGTLYEDNGAAWAAMPTVNEVFYVELATDFTTTSTSLVDVPGLSTPTLTFGDRPFYVTMHPTLKNNTANCLTVVELFESVNGGAFAQVHGSGFFFPNTSGWTLPTYATRRRSFARGTTVVYKVQAFVTPASTGTVVGTASGTPTSLMVEQR